MNQEAIAARTGNPLVGSRLKVGINGLVAEYALEFRFRNDGNEPMEAIYSFPVPLDAAFLGMQATIAGVSRVAEVQPVSVARTEFDDAISDGDSAVLLELVRPGMLCVDLGNLLPGEDGEIILRFAAGLAVGGGQARFSLPLVHRPRYGRSGLDFEVTPNTDFAVEHPLQAEIRISGFLAHMPVHCASHAAEFTREDGVTVLKLGAAMLDRDLVLSFKMPVDAIAQAEMVLDGDGAIGMAHVCNPARGHADTPLDLCLMLDCSASMTGDAIAQSRAAVVAVSRAMSASDKVQVLRFGDEVISLFRRPLAATERVLGAMRELAGTVDSNLGGTRIGSALERAMAGMGAATDGRHRAIILVTDGAVEQSAIQSARDAAVEAGIAIFVVAVGSSAGVDALAPLADSTKGALERAVPTESIDDCVMRQLARARTGQASHMQVDWGEGATPLPVGPLYPGDAAIAVAFLPDARARTVRVRREGVDEALQVDLTQVVDRPALRAWAGQMAYRLAENGRREGVPLKYGLITSETSAVLVRERDGDAKALGLPRVTPVRHMQPYGTLPMFSMRKVAPDLRKLLDQHQPALCCPKFEDDADAERFWGNEVLYGTLSEEPEPRAAAPLGEQRIAEIRVALRAALDRLLLAGVDTAVSRDAILDLIGEELREDVARWFQQHLPEFDGSPIQSAVSLLFDLADDGVGAPLDDEQEACLSALLGRSFAT